MPSWSELVHEYEELSTDADREDWLLDRFDRSLQAIGERRGDDRPRNVICYASSFLQKSGIPSYFLQITFEEINGFMSAMYGMDWDDNLTLLLHTPGGDPNATETVVSYLHSKFDDIEVIVPTYAMSAGTMMALAADRIVMGRQSQLGPIDPQMQFGDSAVSAQSVKEQFETAKEEILENRETAHVWAPVLQQVGPALLQEAENSLAYGKELASEWLQERMLADGRDDGDAEEQAEAVAEHFSDVSTHKSHGRRIDRQEARDQGLVIEDLEDDQQFQDEVLTAYHMATLIFEQTPTSKLINTNTGNRWLKNLPTGQ